MEPSVHDISALEAYHKYTREQGTNVVLHTFVRLILQPAILIWFSVRRTGRENIPAKGAVLIIANHRSFLDPFLIAISMPWRRQMHFMGKAELFQRPRLGWFFSRCGGFPVRRGEADQEAIITAQLILERGGVVALFPEGTRIRYGGLGAIRRGGGRLALLSGAKILPIVLRGTERARKKFLILPAHCSVDICRPIPGRQGLSTPDEAREVLDDAWQVIYERWCSLGGSGDLGTKKKPPKKKLSAKERIRKIIDWSINR
jgi:1-acyl-sn-glycerol-3-phosphate acyltransferase